jgi:DNA-binding MarR family transcriptional regulator
VDSWLSLVRLITWLPWSIDHQLRRDSDLGVVEYQVLARLSRSPERTLRMSWLTDLANASLSRLSHLVKRLEGPGLVRREPDPADGRFTVTILTEKGFRTLAEAASRHVADVRSLVIDVLSPPSQCPPSVGVRAPPRSYLVQAKGRDQAPRGDWRYERRSARGAANGQQRFEVLTARPARGRAGQMLLVRWPRTFTGWADGQFGPLSIRPCHGACWARRKHPVRLRATYHRTHGIGYFHGCYCVGDDQLWGVTREHKGAGAYPGRAEVDPGLPARRVPAVRHLGQPGGEQDPGDPPLGRTGKRRAVPHAGERVVG